MRCIIQFLVINRVHYRYFSPVVSHIYNCILEQVVIISILRQAVDIYILGQEVVITYSRTSGNYTYSRISGNYTCREEENLVFWFGAQFISTLNFTQSG